MRSGRANGAPRKSSGLRRDRLVPRMAASSVRMRGARPDIANLDSAAGRLVHVANCSERPDLDPSRREVFAVKGHRLAARRDRLVGPVRLGEAIAAHGPDPGIERVEFAGTLYQLPLSLRLRTEPRNRADFRSEGAYDRRQTVDR